MRGTRTTGAKSRSSQREASPRLIMAVVAIGMIVGALISPTQTQTPSAPVAAATAGR